jgi:hypothetical protein
MRERGNPWRWPTAIAVALGLSLAAAFVVPRGWLSWLGPAGDGGLEHSPASTRTWLVLQPPPSVESGIRPPRPLEPASERRLQPDPRWWSAGWAVSAQTDKALFRAPVTGLSDTLDTLLGALGLGADFMTRARPDSVLAARLFLLQIQDGFRFDELKPYLAQLQRSATYRDILSRAAELYDEPLDQEIRVPQSGSLKGK